MRYFIIIFGIVFFSMPCFSSKQKDNLYTVTPEEIRRFKDNFKTIERTIYNGPVPVMENKNIAVSLMPDDKAVLVNMLPGYVSTITFVDSTGQPWPIQYHALGNPTHFHVERPDNGQLNLLSVSALKDHQHSNIAVTLEGEDHPIHMMVSSRYKKKQKRVLDASVVLMVQKPGPHAKPAKISRPLGAAADDVIYDVLNQVPPDHALPLDFSHPDLSFDIRGWKINGDFFIRTAQDLTWPAYSQIAMQGQVNVYRVAPVDMIMLSIQGQPIAVEVNISEYNGMERL